MVIQILFKALIYFKVTLLLICNSSPLLHCMTSHMAFMHCMNLYRLQLLCSNHKCHIDVLLQATNLVLDLLLLILNCSFTSFTNYKTDVWFANARNTALTDIYQAQGLYYKGDALVVPNTPELKHTILHELCCRPCCCHKIYNVQCMFW